eukprot:14604-Heterococcus_DN1.PRE.4
MVLFIIAALNKSFTVPTTALVILDNMIILWSIYYALSRGLAEDTPLQRRQSACSSVVVYADKGMAELCSSTPRTAETRRSSLDSCGPVPPSGQGTLLHPNVDSLFLKQRGSFISSLTHIFYSAFLSVSSFLPLRGHYNPRPKESKFLLEDILYVSGNVYCTGVPMQCQSSMNCCAQDQSKACKPHLALHSSLASGSRSLLVTVPDDMLDRTALFPLAVDEGPKAFQYVFASRATPLHHEQCTVPHTLRDFCTFLLFAPSEQRVRAVVRDTVRDADWLLLLGALLQKESFDVCGGALGKFASAQHCFFAFAKQLLSDEAGVLV